MLHIGPVETMLEFTVCVYQLTRCLHSPSSLNYLLLSSRTASLLVFRIPFLAVGESVYSLNFLLEKLHWMPFFPRWRLHCHPSSG